jgi:hypothetical protein
MAKEEKKFEEKVWHIIEETSNEQRGGGTVLKVLSWVVDGKVMRPVIEKRDWYLTEDGQRRVGKAKGLTGFDLLAILRGLPTIASHLKIPAEDINLALEAEWKTGKPDAAAPAGGPF